MIMETPSTERTLTDFVVVHPLEPEDAAITAGMRAAARPTKGLLQGIEARGPFDSLMEGVLPRGDVTFEADTLGDVPGLWVHPAGWRSNGAILHLHGGWFNLGSATAFRHLVGHIAARARVRAFIPAIGALPNILFLPPPTMCWPVTRHLPRGAFIRWLSRETPPEAISHWDSPRALRAKPSPATRRL
jgi:epsilon-lactone hydrolase